MYIGTHEKFAFMTCTRSYSYSFIFSSYSDSIYVHVFILSFGYLPRRMAFAIILFIFFLDLLVVSIRSLRVVYCKDHSAVHQAVPARFTNCPSISIRLFIFKPPVVTPIAVTPGLFKTGGAVVR